IIREAIPYGTTAAVFPPIAGPRFCGFFECGIFERLRRISGNGVEAPHFTAGVDIKGREETAVWSELGAGEPDDHLVLDNARSHCERVTRRVLRQNSSRPLHFSARRIERDQSSVQDRYDDFAFIERESAVEDAAAHATVCRSGREGTVDSRVEAP